MKLAELRELSTKELKELAAKEGVIPEGDKRVRVNWLIALEKHFKDKEILSYQPKRYEIGEPNTGEYWYRRRDIKGYWQRWNSSLLLLKVHLRGLDEFLEELNLASALTQFRRACVPVRQCTRPP